MALRAKSQDKPKPKGDNNSGIIKRNALGWIEREERYGEADPKFLESISSAESRAVETTVGPTSEPTTKPTTVGPTVVSKQEAENPSTVNVDDKNIDSLRNQIAELQNWKEEHEQRHDAISLRLDRTAERLKVVEEKVFPAKKKPELARDMKKNLNLLHKHLRGLKDPGIYVQPGIRDLFRCSDTYADKIRDAAALDPDRRFAVYKKANFKKTRWFVDLTKTINK
jgi:hypothetical protein